MVKKTQEVIVSHEQNVTVDVLIGSNVTVDVVNLDVTSRQLIHIPYRIAWSELKPTNRKGGNHGGDKLA